MALAELAPAVIGGGGCNECVQNRHERQFHQHHRAHEEKKPPVHGHRRQNGVSFASALLRAAAAATKSRKKRPGQMHLSSRQLLLAFSRCATRRDGVRQVTRQRHVTLAPPPFRGDGRRTNDAGGLEAPLGTNSRGAGVTPHLQTHAAH
ncbi:hypothetical protein TcG_03046 [Trypanosoma cruzi]|nr:hypothetical protein TcG_03046 [Trypanosoma cruzi]